MKCDACGGVDASFAVGRTSFPPSVSDTFPEDVQVKRTVPSIAVNLVFGGVKFDV